ncbi:ATP-dependent DNA helicase, partial [Phytophthora megakarya]
MNSRHRQMVLVQQVTDRKNLRMEVVRKTSQAATWIANRVGKATTIVYCMTRKEAEDTCLALVRAGCHAGVYHGGLPRKRREFVRKQWMMGQLTIICATSAFGMGIDRADVRFVVHHSIPLSLSAYSQQIGRSGRDGKPAVCVLLYSEADKGRADTLATERPDFDGMGSAAISNGSSRGELDEVAAFCEMTTGCRKELLYSHFGFRFDSTRCVKNCNCGEALEIAEELWRDEWSAKEENSKQTEDDEDSVPKGTIEYQYQKILAESKRLKLPKREALSRRLIRDILETKPASEDEMASMRGIGPAKAGRYFQFFRFD